MADRLTGRYVFVYKDKRRGTLWGATNMATLARKSGISYPRIRYWFDTLNKDGVEFDLYRIDRLPRDLIFTKNDK